MTVESDVGIVPKITLVTVINDVPKIVVCRFFR
jgi:hypothetical protein